MRSILVSQPVQRSAQTVAITTLASTSTWGAERTEHGATGKPQQACITSGLSELNCCYAHKLTSE